MAQSHIKSHPTSDSAGISDCQALEKSFRFDVAGAEHDELDDHVLEGAWERGLEQIEPLLRRKPGHDPKNGDISANLESELALELCLAHRLAGQILWGVASGQMR